MSVDVPGYIKIENHIPPPTNILKVVEGTVGECASECSKEDKCEVFSHRLNSISCTLYTTFNMMASVQMPNINIYKKNY
jgi:hypothetical protein